MRQGSEADEVEMEEAPDSGVDGRKILREIMEEAVFESPPSVPPAPEVEVGPPEKRAVPAGTFRRTGLAGGVLMFAGAAWTAQAMASKSWIACLLAAGFLTAGVLLLGRAALREKP